MKINVDVWAHGEVCIKKSKGGIPEGAKKVVAVNGVYKIADSETTGNHHLLEEIEGCDLYEKDGFFYLKTSAEPVVRCVDEKRHDTITLEPCQEDEVYTFGRQLEVDHLSDEIRPVAD